MKIDYYRPKLYKKQRDAFFNNKRYAVIEASTKSGKTVAGLIWLFEQALTTGKAGRNYWWVAPVYIQARMAYARLKRSLPHMIAKANDSMVMIQLINKAQIWFKGSDNPDSLYGEDVFACVIDEASRCREDAWFAVRTTLTKTRGMVRIIGNVKGKKNWFYKMARRAEAGAKDTGYYRITAYDAEEAGVLHMDEIQDARNTLPPHIFKELYLAEASDDNKWALWTQDKIDECRVYSIDFQMDRIVIGVDPQAISESGGLTGIVVVGEYNNKYYVLEDGSISGQPETWARQVVALYHKYDADYVIAEKNQGGDMVESTLRRVDENINIKTVWATKNKMLRAEPVSVLYGQRKVFHLGYLLDLENQMTSYTGDKSQPSPDRLDALVYALTFFIDRAPTPEAPNVMKLKKMKRSIVKNLPY